MGTKLVLNGMKELTWRNKETVGDAAAAAAGRSSVRPCCFFTHTNSHTQMTNRIIMQFNSVATKCTGVLGCCCCCCWTGCTIIFLRLFFTHFFPRFFLFNFGCRFGHNKLYSFFLPFLMRQSVIVLLLYGPFQLLFLSVSAVPLVPVFLSLFLCAF